MEYTLRPATNDDFEFLLRLRAAALGPYVAHIWGWNDDDQRQRFARAFDPAHYQIVHQGEALGGEALGGEALGGEALGGEALGAIEVEQREHETHLVNIALLPRHQGKGVGAALIRSVIARADADNVPVTLQVFKINPARHLYERLGFVVTGETATHYQMRRPVSGRDQ
jgi:ribosomal protein S18 acetylase RimI-like enzyme